MPKPLSPGDLRACVIFERRGLDDNGDRLGAWTFLARRRAALEPTRGGEAVMAQRLTESVPYDLWLRRDSVIAGVTAADRVADARDPARTFAIKAGPLDLEHDGWLLFQLLTGVADG